MIVYSWPSLDLQFGNAGRKQVLAYFKIFRRVRKYSKNNY